MTFQHLFPHWEQTLRGIEQRYENGDDKGSNPGFHYYIKKNKDIIYFSENIKLTPFKNNKENVMMNIKKTLAKIYKRF